MEMVKWQSNCDVEAGLNVRKTNSKQLFNDECKECKWVLTPLNNTYAVKALYSIMFHNFLSLYLCTKSK